MLIYHNSASCCNMEKKVKTKNKSISKSRRKSASKSTSKSTTKRKNPVKKGYKCASKSKKCVISLGPLKRRGRKNAKTSNKKLSEKNQEFLEGLGLKVKKA